MKKIVAPLLLIVFSVLPCLTAGNFLSVPIVKTVEAKTVTVTPTLVVNQNATPSATLTPTAIPVPHFSVPTHR